jgi:hypothetical protein
VEDRSRVFKRERLTKLEGIDPVTRVDIKVRKVNLVKLPNSAGIGPVIEFKPMLKYVSADKAENVDGIFPANRLFVKRQVPNLTQFPNDGGIVPERRFQPK